MKLLGWLIAGAFAITLFNTIAGVLSLLLLLAMTICLFAFPKDTIAILVCLSLLKAFNLYPLVGLGVMYVVYTIKYLENIEKYHAPP